jgi:hypothetical protein
MILKYALFAMTCFAITACCPQQALVTPDAFEPNDSITQAKPITASLEGTISEGESLDFYSFTATARERVKFSYTLFNDSDLGIALEVQDLEGNVIRNTLRPGDGIRSGIGDLELALPTGGQFVLKMQAVYTGPADSFCASGRGSYRLKLVRNGTLGEPVVTVGTRGVYSVALSWTAVDGATGYVVEQKVAPDGVWKTVSVLPATSTSKVATDLLENLAYVFRVRSSLGDVLSVGTEVSVGQFGQ